MIKSLLATMADRPSKKTIVRMPPIISMSTLALVMMVAGVLILSQLSVWFARRSGMAAVFYPDQAERDMGYGFLCFLAALAIGPAVGVGFWIVAAMRGRFSAKSVVWRGVGLAVAAVLLPIGVLLLTPPAYVPFTRGLHDGLQGRVQTATIQTWRSSLSSQMNSGIPSSQWPLAVLHLAPTHVYAEPGDVVALEWNRRPGPFGITIGQGVGAGIQLRGTGKFMIPLNSNAYIWHTRP